MRGGFLSLSLFLLPIPILILPFKRVLFTLLVVVDFKGLLTFKTSSTKSPIFGSLSVVFTDKYPKKREFGKLKKKEVLLYLF